MTSNQVFIQCFRWRQCNFKSVQVFQEMETKSIIAMKLIHSTTPWNWYIRQRHEIDTFDNAVLPNAGMPATWRIFLELKEWKQRLEYQLVGKDQRKIYVWKIRNYKSYPKTYQTSLPRTFATRGYIAIAMLHNNGNISFVWTSITGWT